MKDGEFPYEDIVDLPHYVSWNHPHMSLHDRAAQFAPFAALTGYDEGIGETARLTEERRELDEDERAVLDSRLRLLTLRLDEQPPVVIEHFVPDKRKAGGAYVKTRGRLAGVSSTSRTLILADGTAISFDDITPSTPRSMT